MLSIIIPVFNEEKDISECLNSLLMQTYKNFEIIIVDDGSMDGTLDVCKNFSKINKNIKVRIFNQNHQGPGAARNLGAKNSKGQILIFIDADMTFDKNYLKYLVKPILNKKIIGTTHELEVVKNIENIWSRCWGKVRVSKESSKKDSKIFRAIRKDKFLELGGFDPKLGYADDQTFWFRNKIKPISAEDTICYHKNPENLKSVYKQSRWIGASIENKILNIWGLNLLLIIFLILISPIGIIIFAIKKTNKTENWKIFFPWMLIFSFFRYFGTVEGIFRRLYLNKNMR